MQTGAPLGVGLAAIVGSFVAPAVGWRAVFMLSALPALLVTAVRRWVPESDLWDARRADPAPARASGIAELLRGRLGRVTLCAFVLTVLNMSAYWFTFTWLPTYLREERGLSVAKSGLWILVIVSGELLGYLTFGLASDRFGRKPAFTVYASLMGTGLLAITLGWELVASDTRWLLGSMAIVGVGTGTWSNFGPQLAELFPTQWRATAMGTIYNGARGVQFATPIVVQSFSESYRLSGGIALASAFCFAAALWIWTLPETRARVFSPHE